MIQDAPDIRKHFYNLNDEDDRKDAEERSESLLYLIEDADKCWEQNGFTHILVNNLCIKIRSQRRNGIFYLEWRTSHISQVEIP